MICRDEKRTEPTRPTLEREDQSGEVTDLLEAWNRGEKGAEDRLAVAIYPELRRLTAARLVGFSGEVSLQATELAHEVYFKLRGQIRTSWRNRAQLFAVLSRLTRRLLVDHARRRSSWKRGGAIEIVTLEPSMRISEGREIDLVALDRALSELAEIDEEAVRVVEALFFSGLTHDEASLALGMGRATVGRKWRFARAWLQKRLSS